MFTCKACLRKALQNLKSDLLPNNILVHQQTSTISSSTSRVQSSKQRRSIQYRSHATLVSLKRGHHRRDLIKLNSNSKAKNSPLSKGRRRAPWALTGTDIKDAQAREKNRAWLRDEVVAEEEDEAEDIEEDQNDDEDLVRPSEAKELTKAEEKEAFKARQEADKQRRLEMKLTRRDQKDVEQYYQNPLQLASAVLQRLRVPDFNGALRLVRASQSLDVKNIVSWNHCMDWLMMQGDVNQSIKVYNEMKKRGQMPDAHTYTIMLRGFSQHIKHPNAVKEAVKIYNSMFAPNSTVTPNTIHTNAIINVCARGGDMDSLWAVAGRLPEKGPGCPDRLTYTLIFNAIRENTIREVARTADRVKYKGDPAAAEDERKKMLERAVADGRKLWEDVSYKWRRADLVIDEQLVCAMGRLLTGCGVGHDVEQVLDLVEGTMNITIPERRGKRKSSLVSPDSVAQEGHGHDAGNANSLPLQKSTVYATPGQQTLALLLEACQVHKPIQGLASSYWHALTITDGPFNVKPDAANIVAYLRHLRISRSSQKAYNLLAAQWPDDVAKALYRRATFVIAFSACSRDKNNPNVFRTAQKILQLMREKLEEQELGVFDDGLALSDMNGKQRKMALKKQKQDLKDMTEEELLDHKRQNSSSQSLPVDPKVLKYFVELAIDTTAGWNEGIRGKDDGQIFERDSAKNHTMIALRTISPLIEQSKRLLKLKLDEAQFDKSKGRLSRRDDNQNRTKSVVLENVGELLDLMRLVIGAYDKMLDMAERFTRVGKTSIDESLVQSYNSRKREYNAYMAKVERTLSIKRKEAQAFADEDELDQDNADNAEDVHEPEISKRIKAVLGEVDSKILQDRADKKTVRGTRSVFQEETQLKIHSRNQRRERETLLNREMGRHFPKSDYGVLDEGLQVETGKESKARIEARERLRNSGAMNVTGMSSEQIMLNRAKKRQRPPMIGDELGLDDEDPDIDDRVFNKSNADMNAEKEDIPFEPQMSKISDNEGSTKLTSSSILDRDDVKRAWSRPAPSSAQDSETFNNSKRVAAAVAGNTG